MRGSDLTAGPEFLIQGGSRSELHQGWRRVSSERKGTCGGRENVRDIYLFFWYAWPFSVCIAFPSAFVSNFSQLHPCSRLPQERRIFRNKCVYSSFSFLSIQGDPVVVLARRANRSSSVRIRKSPPKPAWVHWVSESHTPYGENESWPRRFRQREFHYWRAFPERDNERPVYCKITHTFLYDLSTWSFDIQ